MESNSLTLDTVLALTKKLEDTRPKLYYGLSEYVKPGESVLLQATEYHPRFFVCHPDDFAQISQWLKPMNLIPLSDYKPTWPGLL